MPACAMTSPRYTSRYYVLKNVLLRYCGGWSVSVDGDGGGGGGSVLWLGGRKRYCSVVPRWFCNSPDHGCNEAYSTVYSIVSGGNDGEGCEAKASPGAATFRVGVEQSVPVRQRKSVLIKYPRGVTRPFSVLFSRAKHEEG